jgi:hypothetical protein
MAVWGRGGERSSPRMIGVGIPAVYSAAYGITLIRGFRHREKRD